MATKSFMKYFYRNQRGITLVELLVGVAVLSAVLAIGYTFFSFVNNSFTRGEKSSDIRQNVHLATEFITQELRYATHVRIYESFNENFTDPVFVANDSNGYSFIYVDADGFLMYREAGAAMPEKRFEVIAQKPIVNLSLEFSFNDGALPTLLNFKVTNVEEDNYFIESAIGFINEIKEWAPKSADPGVAIAYKYDSLTIKRELPNATKGEPYSHEFQAIGGESPYTFTLTGTLPAGMAFTDGVLAGTPTEIGTFIFTVTVTDAGGATDTHEFTFVVEQAALVIDATNPPNGTMNEVYPGHTFGATGGKSPYTFALTAGALPPGLTLTDGVLGGTPTTAGTFTFTVTATDAGGATNAHEYTIVIDPAALMIDTTNPPDGTINEPYPGHTFGATGGVSPYTFTLTAGALPPGMTLSSGGVLGGTPTTAGTFIFTVTVNDSQGRSVEQEFTLVVNNVVLDDFVTFIIEESVFVYGTQLSFAGDNVIGPDATMVIKGDLNTDDTNLGAHIGASNIYIYGSANLDGGSASLGSSTHPGSIFVDGDMHLWNGSRNIYGTVHVNGNFYLKDARIHGTVYVAGDVELGWTPWLASDARVYYIGNLTHPSSMSSSITSKFIKVTSVPDVDMPDHEIPPIKEDAWFNSRGYVSGGTLNSNMKIFADSYTSSSWRPTIDNVIIVAKDGDITITGLGESGIRGVFYAPKGKVTFNGLFLEGLVIARDGFFVTSGGTTVTFKGIENYISNPADYPF